MSEYKTFEELKEELGDEFEDYMYKANIELLNIIKEVKELVEQYSWNTYYYQCSSSRKYFKSEIISDLKQILDKEDI